MACIYILKQGDEELTFKDEKSLVKHIRDNKLYNILSPKQGTPSNTTDSLAAVLRQMTFGENNFSAEDLRKFQADLLSEFVRIEEQSDFFYNAGSPLSLTKGLGKNLDSIANIKRKIETLGVDGELLDSVPFDVRYLITGREEYKTSQDQYSHGITANNVKILKEIDSLSRTMFMELTHTFQNTLSKVLANLKPNLISDKVRELMDELSAFSQIAAYKQWIKIHDRETSTLRNSLIYDTLSPTPTIIDIVKDAQRISPDNEFLKFVLPVSTTVRIGKRNQRNILNRDLINIIEGKTRGKLEPDLIAGMMDSFSDLYSNPTTKFHAKALFDYLIVKDGLMFKNKSFIKLLPTELFKDISDATSIATSLMGANTIEEYRKISNKLRETEVVNKEGIVKPYFNSQEALQVRDFIKEENVSGLKNLLFVKQFGLNVNDFYHKFEELYSNDIRNQYNLDLVKTTVNVAGRRTKPEGMLVVLENNVKNIYIDLFPAKFSTFKKDSEERSDFLAKNVAELKEIGFPVLNREHIDGDKSKSDVYFKKYIRILEPGRRDVFGSFGKATYTTYRLVSISRDFNTYTGSSMTVDGELVPRGSSAKYVPVAAVGASNTTGVANLGKRPTKDEILAVIAAKNKRSNGDDEAAGAVVPNDIPTPGLDGGVLGSDESGTSFTFPNTQSIDESETTNTPVQDKMNDFTNHSGGAAGGDTQWDIIGREFGVINHRHYREPGTGSVDSSTLRSRGVKPISASKTDYEEGIQKATQAAKDLGRRISEKYGHYQYRNWLQVKYADAIYAVSTILNKGQKDKKGFTAATKQVEGGTAYAVQMAINEGKPVFVFDQIRNKWFEVDYATDLFGKKTFIDFVETTTPVLTKNYAGIGSREINDNGIRAIREVYSKTAQSQVTNTIQSTTETSGNINPPLTGTFAGLQAMPYDPSDIPFDTFTDNEVNEDPC